ncbi:hypothetical protein BDW59DRAFT_164486 [Aspergillus cavernicola]|uniref:Uncharacterized protein n=1 Tax=Aspergillus cavernicola TaxID=176166 RepID=A0ABR4HZM1_9EURO
MALISSTNLLTLHGVSKWETAYLRTGPSKRYNDNYKSRRPVIPALELFNGLSKHDPGPETLPTTSECAVHLEMLEVFHALRHEVIQSKELDVAFGIAPNIRTVYRKTWRNREYVVVPQNIKDEGFEARRNAKWGYFLSIAAARFHDWIEIVDKRLNDAESGFPLPVPELLLLPPLDVLVIWHAFLLNCDDFKDYCNTRNLNHIQAIVFPWADIHAAINSNTWKYTLPAEHRTWLHTAEIHPNLVEALATSGKAKGPVLDLLSSFPDDQQSIKPNHTNSNPVLELLSSFSDYLQITRPKTTDSKSVQDLLSSFPDYLQAIKPKSTDSSSSSTPFLNTIKKAHLAQEQNKALVDNVKRQCVFVDKMHAHRWIRSPAVQGTLRRAVDRYDKFLHLFRLYPHQFLVPTLDVDLAWHTHQCSAENYRTFVTGRVGWFINHEDKIGRGTLDGGFTSAEELYRLRFGERYQVCLCWSCEAILSAVEGLEDEDEIEPPVAELAGRIEKEIHFYREVESARRLGRVIPGWHH